MRHFFSVLFCFILFAAWPQSAFSEPEITTKDIYNVHVLNIDGAIGPASADFIKRGITKAKITNADLIILRLNTPGGLVTSTRNIIQTILDSDIPIATYVAPPGAHAASAGTYILYASHIAAMAPGTNIGAATPVNMQGGRGRNGDREKQTKDNEEKALNKALNDAIAQMKGLAEIHGRNIDWAEEAVSKAATLTPSEAKANKAIEFIAEDLDDLIRQVNGHSVTIKNESFTLKTDGGSIVKTNIMPDWRTTFLSIITDPNLVFILMTLGIYGIIYEFSNPGTFFPGVMGVISLLIALYALNVLPVDYAGLGLVLIGIGLLAAEAFVVSYGILGIGGLVAFALGATILFDTDIEAFQISMPTIALTTVFLAGGLTWLLAILIKSQRNPPTTGDYFMIGQKATVEKWTKNEKKVRFEGEVWYAKAKDQSLEPNKGDEVYITAVDNLELTISSTPLKKE